MFDLNSEQQERPVGAICKATSTAHGQPGQIRKLMSEICGIGTRMFFQAPAGCSTITALL